MKSIRDYAFKLNIGEKEYFIANIDEKHNYNGKKYVGVHLTTSPKSVLKRKHKETLDKLIDDLVKFNSIKFYYQRKQLNIKVDFFKFKNDYFQVAIDKLKSEHKEFLNEIIILTTDFEKDKETKIMVLERKMGERRRKIFDLMARQKDKKEVKEGEILQEMKIEIVDVSFNFRKFKLDKIIENTDE